jgi:integrase
VEAFLARKRELGRAESTVESDEDRLVMVLGPVMDRAIRSVLGRGEELYATAQVYPDGHRRAGKRRAADTHQNALAVAKDWAGFCVKRKWLRSNPFAEVEGVGRRVEGADKPRLTVDESRRLQAFCHAHAATDLGAVLTLAYLLLGPRASELVRRNVRDVDDGGRLLWIGATKTAAGRRRLLVPDELAVYLVAIAAGRPGDAPLFVSEASRRWPAGRRWTRHMAYNHVRRVCAAAKVPELAPQALRRTQATLATDAGATGLMVAQHLGHAVGRAPAVTHRSYVERDAARDAAIDRGLRVLQGGRR